MNLFEFPERFPGENDCLNYFIETRQKAGILCQKCGSNKHVWSTGIDRFECKKCGSQIGIKSDTLMENSKLSIKYWFIANHLLTSATEKYSISDIQEKLSGTEPEQVREMLEKLNECLNKLEGSNSFDQLLSTCVANHNHPPAIDKANRGKLFKKNSSIINPITRKQLKIKPKKP